MVGVAVGGPELVQQLYGGYAALREWVRTSSLEAYRAELADALWPLFVHCYIALVRLSPHAAAPQQQQQAAFPHARFFEMFSGDFSAAYGPDVLALAAAGSPQLLEESEVARAFRERKFVVRMSASAVDQLVFFLADRDCRALLNLFNQHVLPEITGAHPLPVLRAMAAVQQQAQQPASFRAGEVIGAQFRREADALASAPAAQNIRLGIPDDLRVRPMLSTAQDSLIPPSAKLPKKDLELSDLPQSTVKYPPPSPSLAREMAADAAVRVTLLGDGAAMPSICMCTLHGAEGLNTAEPSANGAMVAGGFADAAVRLWPSDGRGVCMQQPLVFLGHSGPVYGISFTPDGRSFLSAGGDGTARLWSVDQRVNLVAYKGHAPGEPLWDVAFSAASFYFATASHDTTARVWVTTQPTPVRVLVGHTADVNTVRFHPNCAYVATGSVDNCVRLWDVGTGGCVRLFAAHGRPVTAVAFSPTGKTLASASQDGSIILWDILTGRRLRTLLGHTRPVNSLDFSAEGNVLASASSDGTIRLWNTTPKVIADLVQQSDDGGASGE
jgi:transcription initiation factor TFIID subunit 5